METARYWKRKAGKAGLTAKGGGTALRQRRASRQPSEEGEAESDSSSSSHTPIPQGARLRLTLRRDGASSSQGAENIVKSEEAKDTVRAQPSESEERAEEAKDTARLVDSLMGKNPEKRFKYIQENASLVRDIDV